MIAVLMGMLALVAQATPEAPGTQPPSPAQPVPLPPAAAAPDARPPAPPAPAPPAAPQAAAGPSTACPLALPGTVVLPREIADGIAVEFSADQAGNQADLRQRVRALAGLGAAGLDSGLRACCPNNDAGPAPAALGSVGAEDTEEGARLVLRPAQPRLLPWLRAAVRQQTWRMQADACAVPEP